ncbi:MAG: DUF6198 family protein [Lachnospiraceae bacterium]|nr:DUF6198 family protein [Lachnospiraceae bacterium]
MKRIIRIVLYLLGLVSLAMGNVCSVTSGLGITATSSLGYVLSVISGLTLGTMTIISFVIFIAVQLLLADRREYVKILLQFPFSLFFSYMIDALLGAMTLECESPLMKCAMMLLGIAFTSVGVILTVDVRIVPTAPDGLVRTLSDRFHWNMGNVKNGFDIFLVAAAIILGLCVKGTLTGIGIGTVVAALLTGRVVKLIEKKTQRFFTALVE